MKTRAAAIAALTTLFLSAPLLAARPAGATTVDGVLDAGYGPALVTQTTQTGLSNGQITGDNTDNDLNFASGSELDAAYGFISNQVLYLFLTGNVALELTQSGASTVGHILDVFVDSAPGGQNSLNGLGTGNLLNGLTFDTPFTADYLFELEGSGGSHIPTTWKATYAAFGTPNGATFSTLGSGTAGGPGTLTGGSNPYGVLVTIDNHNVAGVTFGCNAASGAGVTTGVEWAIPLPAIGNPTGCVAVTALIRAPGTMSSPMSNQVLGPLPAGTCPGGTIGLVNFATIAGDQFFQVCLAGTGVPGAPAPGLALVGVGPNPSRGDRLPVSFTLADDGPARLQVVDCAGHLVRAQTARASEGRAGVIDLAGGRPLAPGMYWVRLWQGAGRVTRSVCVVR